MNKSVLRQIKPMKIPDLLPSSILETDPQPEFKWVDPQKLHVEEKYQRNLGEKSVSLIRKIYKDFSWSRFKPPVVSYGADDTMFVIDGQHTAIAALSHPKIKKIPVMIVSADTIRDRANAFMGHNRDRVAITPAQLYYSSVAAEEPIAMIVKKACDETGVQVVRYVMPTWQVGQTMSPASMLKIAERKGLAGITRVLKILMDAKRAPIVASEINAVADLIWGKEWQGKFEDKDLSVVIRSKSEDQWRAYAEANIKKGMAMPSKRAMAIAWYKHVPKKLGRSKGIPIKTL